MVMRTRTLLPLVVALGALALVACGPDYVDTDNTPKTARGVPTDLKVDDDVDTEIGDKVDWKMVVPIDDGTASLVVRVGDPFRGKHDVSGRVVVFDVDAKEFSRANISPNVVRYDLTWEAEAEKTYLIMVEATTGKAVYSIEYSLEVAEKDPCEGVECEDWQKCVDGTCVKADPNACHPECEDGFECDAGECVEVKKVSAGCKPKCKKGHFCRKKKCIKDPCYKKKCGSNEKCKGGKCVEKTKTIKKGDCDPPCASGETCKKGVCKLGPIAAKVIQAIPQGKKTILILSRGSNDKIKKGMTGKLKGVGSFTVKEVFNPFRCRAVINKTSTEIGSAKSATIYR